MTPHIPVVTAQELARVAISLGFKLHRQKGSHAVFYRNKDRARLVIPMHAGKTIKPKILASIVQDMGITMEEFRMLL